MAGIQTHSDLGTTIATKAQLADLESGIEVIVEYYTTDRLPRGERGNLRGAIMRTITNWLPNEQRGNKTCPCGYNLKISEEHDNALEG